MATLWDLRESVQMSKKREVSSVVVLMILMLFVGSSLGNLAMAMTPKEGDTDGPMDIEGLPEEDPPIYESASEVHDIPTRAVHAIGETIEIEEPARVGPSDVIERARADQNEQMDPASGSRIFVLVNHSHVILSLGTGTTGYKKFPVAGSDGKVGLQSGQAVDITGQLVDGRWEDITPIHTGGFATNHGIGGYGPGPTLTVSWTMKDDDGQTIPCNQCNGNSLVDWNSGLPGDQNINGTFKIMGMIPEMSPPGLAHLEFHFDEYVGNAPDPVNGSHYPGCTDTYSFYIQHGVIPTLEVTPDPVNVGEQVTIKGTVKDDEGQPVVNEGLVVSYEDPKGLYTTIGDKLPSGLYIDDVTVLADGLKVMSEDFEEGLEPLGWTHGGEMDEWEVGVPSFGPTSAHSPINCAGTDIDGSYEIRTDSFLQSPLLNFSGRASATISLWAWLDIDDKDRVVLEASADGGSYWTEISRLDPSPVWDSYVFDLSKATDSRDNEKEIVFVGSEQVMVRFRLISEGYSVHTDLEGDYSFTYIVPFESLPGTHSIKLEHPGTSHYLYAMANVSIRVRRVLHFEFIEDEASKVGYRSGDIEIKAKLVDNMGEIPLSNVEGLALSFKVRAFWDPTFNDPSDNPYMIDEKPAVLNSVNESRNGWVLMSYRIPKDQPLGYVYVIFKFEGNDFYKAVNQEDIYSVKAHTKFNLPPPEQLRFYRGTHISLQGSLVIDPKESIIKQDGDPVPFRNVRMTWDSTLLTEATTDLQGRFMREHFVGESHSLGKVQVCYHFDGEFPFEPVDSCYDMSVVSRTYIEFMSDSGFRYEKGKTIEIKAKIYDDLGTPISQRPVMITKLQRGSEKTLGRCTSGIDGTLSLKYKIPFEDRVGDLTISARFDGSDMYDPSQNTTEYSVVIGTTMLRVDDTFEAVRGEQLAITGLLYEDWDGTLGYMVPFEQVSVSLGGVPLTTVLTDIDGNYSIRSFTPQHLDVGPTEVLMVYNGSRFYDGCQNTTTMYVRAHTMLSFEDVNPNRTVWKEQPLSGAVLLRDDNDMPLANKTVKVYWVKESEDPLAVASDPQREIRMNRTDGTGRLYFNVTFRDGLQGKEVSTEPRYLYAIYDGEYMDTGLGIKAEVLTGSLTNHSMEYKIQEQIGCIPGYAVIPILLLASIGSVIIGYTFYEMNKRRALKGMRTIIRKAADQLVAGNEYAAVIFKAYRKLAANMKRYGYMRRDSETFREFEDAIREALPIDQHAMDDFIEVLEEARYSAHEMGEPDRDRAIQALRRVQYSLERISLNEEQIKEIQTRASEMTAADEVEPIIIVQEKVNKVAPPTTPKPKT
jgi:hypothetical protein